MREQGEGAGYGSLEEYMQERMDLLLWLRAKEEVSREGFCEKTAAMEERAQNTSFFLPPEYIRQCYEMTDTEYWLILYALACELDGALGPDFTLQYALHLLSQALPVDYLLIAELSMERGGLNDLLRFSGEEGALLQQKLRLNRAAFCFLLTGEFPGVNWGWLWESRQYLQTERGTPGFLPLHQEEFLKICRIMEAFPSFSMHIHGRRGDGKRTLVKRACLERQADAVFVRINSVLEMDKAGWEEIFKYLRLLQRAINPVYVLELREQKTSAEEAVRFIDTFQKNVTECRVFLLTETEEAFAMAARFADSRVELRDTLSERERELFWKNWIPEADRRDWQQALMQRYRMNIGEWGKKKREMLFEAGDSREGLTDVDFWKTALKSGQRAGLLGTLVEKSREMEDLILPKECKRQLNTIMEIAEGWQGEQGLRILFHGSSGTGKTMTASILAKRLGLPLFKVELSGIFDKYIGETEKHLDEIFRMAQRNNFLLFFDEADALFTRRTDIQNSNDKYANASTAYLLQRMEEYTGIIVLATNLLNHFDDAFVRRIHYVIRFSDMDEETRARLWEKVLAQGPGTEEGVSPRALAQAAAFSPARICSAAQTAAALAGQRGTGVITREQLWEAMELEAVKDDIPLKGFSQ